ncbi:MAG: Uma2 family endonuclease [Eubacteriales bacterium]|nr:Uma2 family endonuclease [Eubacteriales bacterium]
MAMAQPKLYTEDDYYSLPEDIRAELIDGQIYYQAAPSRAHQEILSFLHVEIANYIRAKSGSCRIYPAPFAVKLYKDSETTIVEPDISVICDHTKLTDRGCTGAPDWIVEIISPSTSSHDYIRKLNLYADSGVREYWIVDPIKETIFVYHLEATKFGVNTYTFQDKIKANIYDDLWIDFSQLNL